MTDLEQRLAALSRQPVPQGASLENLQQRVRTIRRRRRVGQAMVGLVAIAVLAAGSVTLWMQRPADMILLDPGESEGPAQDWQRITIGGASLSVPADWPVTTVTPAGPIPHAEHIFRGAPAVYVADRLYAPPGPSAGPQSPPRSPGLYGLPAHAELDQLRWVQQGTPVSVNGIPGHWRAAADLRWYAFVDVDILLWISYDPDPPLMEQILGTLQPVDPPPPPGPEQDPLYSCSGYTYPRSVWTLQEQPADEIEHPGLDVLLERLNVETLQGWFLLESDDDYLTVGHTLDQPQRVHDELVTHQAADIGKSSLGEWVFNQATCALRLVTPNAGPGRVWLDGVPDPTSTRLHLLVHELACASGRNAEGRTRLVTLNETDDTIEVGIVVDRPEAGTDVDQTCPGHPATPMIVELSLPIGARQLINVSVYPPTALEPAPDTLER